VSVVVILGAIIAAVAITTAALAEEGQPPTSDEPAGSTHHRSEPDAEVPTAVVADAAPIVVPAADVRDEGTVILGAPATDPGLGWWHQLRSVVLLAVLIAVLGVIAAGLLAVVLVGGASVIDKALG
jgi:hypothetical protein